MLIDPLSFSILIRINDLTLFTHSERVEVLLFTFCPMSAIFLEGLHKNFKVMFPVYGVRLTLPAGLYEWGIFICQSNIYPPLL